MEKIICEKCGNEIIGRPIGDYDDKGDAIQLIDFTCPCGFWKIKNPKANIP